MLRHQQGIYQKQTLQQKLSPQQIQYIKMLQMNTQVVEARIKEELEMNPTLEDPEQDLYEGPETSSSDSASESETEEREVDDSADIDWDSYYSDSSDDGGSWSGYRNPDMDDWRDLPSPYHESQLEQLENQVLLLDITEKEMMIADQILGSIDDDGYFRRALSSVADGLAFQTGVPVTIEEVEKVLRIIQRLDPPGIAARNLRECLLVQLELMSNGTPGRELAMEIIRYHWDDFEKKHFERIMKRMQIEEDDFRSAYECLKMLDPKPGEFDSAVSDAGNYIIPDFEVYYQPGNSEENPSDEGDFVILLHRRNMPELRISSRYERMLEDLNRSGKKEREKQETKLFIKDKIESAKWFIDMLRQRSHTLLNVMQTIVALQEPFFKTGKGIKPMILKDIADRVNLDVSTISRVVNGKYVQTPFGVFELKYFFNEGISTESGEDVSNLEVKKLLSELIDSEPKKSPYSDQRLTQELNKKGFKLARRTVTKYREQLKYPPARLRKMVI